MIKNNKGHILNSFFIVSAIIVVISFGILVNTNKVSDTVKNNKLSSNSIIDVNNTRIDNTHEKGNLYVSGANNYSNINTVNLEESKTLNVNIPQNNISDSKLRVNFNTGSPNRYIGLELSKSRNNKLLVNKTIDTRGGFVIKVSSAWTETIQESKYNDQVYYLKENNISDLSNFLTSEIDKIGEPGSYLLFDFGYSTIFNRFNFRLTQEDKTSFPNIIQLTFDNGVQHNFLIDDSKVEQVLTFPDIETRYIRLDILSTSDGRIDTDNASVVSNIDRNILESEITVSDNTTDKVLDISFPNLSLISGVKFVNLYSGSNGSVSTNPFKSVLSNETNFKYYYNNISLDTIYFELCSDINACLDKVAKPIN